MAKINFPDSPTDGQEFVLNDNRTYVWNDTAGLWEVVIQGASPSATAPTITIVTEAPDGVTFTLTNNDDNTAIISYEVDNNTGAVELAAAATSSNITVALSAGTYTLSAYATVVGEVATQSTAAVEIVVIEFELLYDSNVSATLPATQIDITGLNITKDDELRMVWTVVGSITAIRMYANDVNTDASYTVQRIEGENTGLVAARFNFPRIGEGIKSFGITDIKVSNNDRIVWQSHCIRNIGSSSGSMMHQYFNGVLTSQTFSSITKLSLKAEANQMTSGSRIRLYKVNTGAA